MKKQYVYDWLDTVISVELNPQLKTKPFTKDAIQDIRKRIEEEDVQTIRRIKEYLFRISDEKECRAFIKNHHNALIMLVSRNYDNLNHPAGAGLKALHEFIGNHLERLLNTFEQEFHRYMGDDNLVPVTTLIGYREHMFRNELAIKEKLSAGEMGTGPVHVVMEALLEFSEKIDARLPVSRREAQYMVRLVDDILAIDGDATSITGCPVLNELLISWNLNSRTCIQYFTFGIEYMLNQLTDADERLEFLHRELKKVQIIPERQGYVLKPEYPSVKQYCINWLENELGYLERKSAGFQPIAEETLSEDEQGWKVMCNLSIDQIGLLLRALDESRTLIARSFNAVLKSIVPRLSTRRKANISYHSVRTKAYAAESTDRQVCIDLLDDLKKRIMQY